MQMEYFRMTCDNTIHNITLSPTLMVQIPMLSVVILGLFLYISDNNIIPRRQLFLYIVTEIINSNGYR